MAETVPADVIGQLRQAVVDWKKTGPTRRPLRRKMECWPAFSQYSHPTMFLKSPKMNFALFSSTRITITGLVFSVMAPDSVQI